MILQLLLNNMNNHKNNTGLKLKQPLKDNSNSQLANHPHNLDHSLSITPTENNKLSFQVSSHPSFIVDNPGKKCQENNSLLIKNGNESSNKVFSKGHWTPSEDAKLKELVFQFGAQDWNSIAQYFDDRSGKSCRLRWLNQLDPRVNNKPFTREEELRLKIIHEIYGNKWAFIAKLFPGRTDNAIKNHCHMMKAKEKRENTFLSKRNFLMRMQKREDDDDDEKEVNVIMKKQKSEGINTSSSQSRNSGSTISINVNNKNGDDDESGGPTCTDLSLFTTMDGGAGCGNGGHLQLQQYHQPFSAERQKGKLKERMCKSTTNNEDYGGIYDGNCNMPTNMMFKRRVDNPLFRQLSNSNSDASGSADSVVTSGQSSLTAEGKHNNTVPFFNFLGLELII